ncbi:PAS/PAC sensor hybrid histidine kinase [Desulfosarcina cetonica]|nr:PAS/PAC sensor hybrid histidine kinase [Desulfosarcina cetonica]
MTTDDWSVLIIDDERDIREVTALTLMDAGYRVETAVDGLDGLACCETFAPQIVITDIRMPRMDGLQFLDVVKQRFPDTEVIVTTAFGEMETAIRALRLDASDFITKPIHSDALMVALSRATHRFATRQQLKDYTRRLERGLDQTTHQLEETVAYLQRLIESSMDGICGCDADNRIITVNQSMETLFGVDRSQLIGRRSLADFFSPEAYRRLERDLVGPGHGGPGRLMLYDTRLKDQAGQAVPVQLAATVLSDADQPAGLVCFFRDLRRIHRLQQEMADQARFLHQDKMMSLGRLAASVAHEINNPLAGILNYVRLMLRTLQKGPLPAGKQAQFVEYLSLVETETDRCAKIVSSLLTFSRKSPITTGPVAMDEVLSRSIVLAGHRLELAKISLQAHVADDLPPIEGDANQLQQCLLNLIFNAIDAMPDGGTLTLSAGVDKPAGVLRLTVEDTGHGIPPEDMGHIFEPFFSTKPEGTGIGLGLATTYGIIERHRGTLSVESTPGRGTVFTIRLPLSPADDPPPGSPS